MSAVGEVKNLRCRSKCYEFLLQFQTTKVDEVFVKNFLYCDVDVTIISKTRLKLKPFIGKKEILNKTLLYIYLLYRTMRRMAGTQYCSIYRHISDSRITYAVTFSFVRCTHCISEKNSYFMYSCIQNTVNAFTMIYVDACIVYIICVLRLSCI